MHLYKFILRTLLTHTRLFEFTTDHEAHIVSTVPYLLVAVDA